MCYNTRIGYGITKFMTVRKDGRDLSKKEEGTTGGRDTWSARRYAVMPPVQKALDADDMEMLEDALPVMQKHFCQEYIIDFNGAAAVRRCGSKSTFPEKSAYLWLCNPGVKRYIKHLTEERTEQLRIDQGYVLNKIIKAVEKAEQQGNLQNIYKGAELLARYLGMLRDRVEHTGADGAAIQYEKLSEDADAFTRSIASLAERERKTGLSGDTQH